MMTKFDWDEMKRAKVERQQKEQELKDVVAFVFQVCGGFTFLFMVAAVFK